MSELNLNSILKSLHYQADWISLRAVTDSYGWKIVRDGKFDTYQKSHDSGLMVEVLVDGHFAHAGTHILTKDGIQNAVDKATNLARKASIYKVATFSLDQRPKSDSSYQTNMEQKLDSISNKELNDLLIAGCNNLKASDKIISSQAMILSSNTSTQFVSSNGSDFSRDINTLFMNFSATAQDGKVIQKRSFEDFSQAGLEFFNREHILSETKRVGEEALELLSAKECPSGNYDLLLHPDQLYLQVHESIGHPLELDRILGDERNYAGWSFVKPEDFGKLQYGSKLLNITFDPTIKNEAASYQCDDTGIKATKEHIIKDGILVRAIGGIESQTRSDIPGVSCSRGNSWNRAPIDRMANINIEPGSSTLPEMIKNTEKGIYMKTNRSWSIDDYRNKFQFGCEYGQLIENGKLTGTVKNPNYRGISTPFWNNLIMVGDKSTLEVKGSPWCGKGEPNQIAQVGHAIPTCLFENVEVFGGAQ